MVSLFFAVVVGFLESLLKETVESCARCVVSMMEQDWPQNWPDLNSLLQLMSSKSMFQKCGGLHVFLSIFKGSIPFGAFLSCLLSHYCIIILVRLLAEITVYRGNGESKSKQSLKVMISGHNDTPR